MIQNRNQNLNENDTSKIWSSWSFEEVRSGLILKVTAAYKGNRIKWEPIGKKEGLPNEREQKTTFRNWISIKTSGFPVSDNRRLTTTDSVHNTYLNEEENKLTVLLKKC